jgi:Aconitase A
VHRQLGPLSDEISKAVVDNDLVVCSVLSGNRNFEARIHPEVKANYLASPPLVVAYALAGRMDIDLENEPLGVSKDGEGIYLRDIWPTAGLIAATIAEAVQSEMFAKTYADVFTGDETGARSTCRPARSSSGSRTPPTSAARRTSRG